MAEPYVDPVIGEDGGGGDAGSQPVNPLVFVHRLLRGRYLLAVPLAILVAPIGAVVGYKAMPPVYTSTGLVQVQSSIPKILYDTEENAPLASFDQFVEAQARFLSDRRVLDKAAADPELRSANWPGGNAGLQALQGSLEVKHGRRSAIISVEVSAVDPSQAQAAVNAVLRSYFAIFGERDGLVKTARERALEQIERDLSQRSQSLRTSIFEVAEETGSADTLRRLHESRSANLEQLEQRIADLQMEITRRSALLRDDAAGDGARGGARDDVSKSPGADLSISALGARDPELSQLLAQRDSLQEQIRVASGRFGRNHRTMINLRNRVDALDVRILSRKKAVLAILSSSAPVASDSTMNVMSGVTIESLKQMESDLLQRRERMRTAVLDLGRKRLRLTQFEDELHDVEEQLSNARQELNALRVESKNAAIGRITIASWGEAPLAPSKDRRLPLAVIGAGGLAGGVLGLFGLIGLLDQRWRYIDDADWLSQAALLGSLPDLATGAEVDREIAAASIHQLRNVLSLEAERSRAKVFAITSATAEAGKTSLSLALGLSFASGGWRTLLIDADLVGGGLTDELKLRDISGLVQVLQSGEVNGEIHQPGGQGMHVLPCGKSDGFSPEHLSPAQVRKPLGLLRERFDIVLLDTGPLLGSLEANLAVATVDETILIAPRGQSMKQVRAALARISEVGGTCAGIVFNRARSADVHRSVSRSSIISPYASATADHKQRGVRQDRSALANALEGDDASSTSKRASA